MKFRYGIIAPTLLALCAGSCARTDRSAPEPVVATQTPQTTSPPVASAMPTKPQEEPEEPAKPVTLDTWKPMNVILMVVDAMRYDMPWDGYERDCAPNLTRLHKESVSYERGYATASFTSKSVATLLSGKYPSSLSRTTPFFTKYRDKQNLMLAEHLQQKGVRTIGGHAHMYFEERAGYHQGFDVWDLVDGIEWDYNKDPYVTSPQHTKLVIDQLSKKENTQKTFFAYYHYMDPHHEYMSHEIAPHWGKRHRDLYDEEIWFTDLHIQKALDFIDSQPWGKNTALIVTADHGEAFGEHGFFKHAFELYEVLIRVPLFVYVPGVKGRRVERWRSHVDVAPTVCDMLGVKPPEGLPGTSLLPEILGAEAPKRPILADLPADTLNVRHRALIDEDGYKLVSTGRDVRFQLFNVKDDPGETKDLFGKEDARSDAMVDRYRKLFGEVPFEKANGGRPVKPD